MMFWRNGRSASLAIFLLIALILLSGGVSLAQTAQTIQSPQALPLDCDKCHLGIVTQFFNQGEMHKEALDCLGCHMEHASDGDNVIPDCSLCHAQDESLHYSVTNCTGCHNPHAPLDIDFSGVESVRQACVSCHMVQKEEFDLYPSSHVEMDCNECHQEHGDAFSCLDCHEPHSDKIDKHEDCVMCHQPHMPTVIRYPDTLSVSYCSACHADETTELQSSALKHRTFKCTFCHRVQHKSVPDCGTCHGAPHKASLHNKIPDCKECHNGAHDLQK